MKKEVVLTKHYKQRAESFKDINHGRKDKKLAVEAFRNGKGVDYFTGKKKKYLKDKQNEKTYPLYYNGFIYIFTNESRCVTFYPAPTWFVAKNTNKEKIKNYVKYQKYNQHLWNCLNYKGVYENVEYNY